MANTTLNPSDKSANGSLSGGNLIFTTGLSSGVRSVARASSGKFYFEYTPTTWINAQSVGGIGTANTPLTTAAQNAVGACILQKSGSVFCNDATVRASLGALVAGNVIGVAFDVGAKLIWFRVAPSGNWNGNAGFSPGGTGGVSFAALSPDPTGLLLPIYAFVGGNIVSDSITVNFGDSAFTGAVPSGFTAGFPVSAPSLYAAETQVAIEQWSNPSPQAQLTQTAIEQWGLSGTVSTQATVTQVALEQWASLVVRPPVDLAGNLGGVSSYGKRSYGVRHYCREGAFEPILSAALTVSIGRALSGDFSPVVSLGGSLGIVRAVSGSLTPVVTFAADLTRIGFIDFVGGLAPQIGLGGSLAVDVSFTVLEGGLTPIVSLGASSMISGPLWAGSEPCPSAPWTDSEPCPPPAWMLSDPCAPVAWTPTRLCNG